MSTPILSEGNFSVDSNIIKIGETSYSVSSIGSVSLKKEDSIFAGVLFLISLFFGFAIGSAEGFIWGFVSFFILLIIIATLGKSKIEVATYKVMIKNSSGDQPILTTKNKEQALRLKSAIEEAIQTRV